MNNGFEEQRQKPLLCAVKSHAVNTPGKQRAHWALSCFSKHCGVETSAQQDLPQVRTETLLVYTEQLHRRNRTTLEEQSRYGIFFERHHKLIARFHLLLSQCRRLNARSRYLCLFREAEDLQWFLLFYFFFNIYRLPLSNTCIFQSPPSYMETLPWTKTICTTSASVIWFCDDAHWELA